MADRCAYESADQPTDLTAHTRPDQRTKWLAITKPDFRSDRGTHRTAVGITDTSAKQDPDGAAVVVAQREPQREPDIRPFLPADDRSAVHAGRWLLQEV